RIHRRLHRLCLAAAPGAAGGGGQLRLRQSGHRGAAGRLAGARALRRRRPGGHGRHPARRAGDDPGPGAHGRARAPMSAAPLDRKGLAVAAVTVVLWGVVPLYWNLLKAVPALHIIMHRIVWSALLVVGWLLIKDGWGWLRKIRAQPRALPILGLTSVLI